MKKNPAGLLVVLRWRGKHGGCGNDEAATIVSQVRRNVRGIGASEGNGGARVRRRERGAGLSSRGRALEDRRMAATVMPVAVAGIGRGQRGVGTGERAGGRGLRGHLGQPS